MYIKYFLRSQNIFSCPGSVSFTIEADEVVLVCQAAGFPSDLTFWWEKANDTYTEPVAGDEEDGNTLRIKISNETNGKILKDTMCAFNCRVVHFQL